MRTEMRLTCYKCIAVVLVLGSTLLTNRFVKIINGERKTDHGNVTFQRLFLKEHSISRGNYKIVPNVATPNEEYKVPIHFADIGICTQTSLSNLHYIKTLAETWEGEISLTVFSVGVNVSMAYEYIQSLRACHKDVRTKVRFHMVYPVAHPPTSDSLIMRDEVNCGKLAETQRRFANFKENWNVDDGIEYPVNVLRNIAIDFSESPYIFNIDVDFLPSKGLMTDMKKYIIQSYSDKNNQKEKLAFVIPGFESNMSTAVGTKSELLEAISAGYVRQFGLKKCPQCHAKTNYSRWFDLPTQNDMSISYYVSAARTYEPPYIAHRNNFPKYDERFVNYGYDRFSQVCEAFMNGLSFGVMNNGFIVHDGFKLIGQFYPWKRRQNEENRKIFESDFKNAMKMKYPNSTHLCGWY